MFYMLFRHLSRISLWIFIVKDFSAVKIGIILCISINLMWEQGIPNSDYGSKIHISSCWIIDEKAWCLLNKSSIVFDTNLYELIKPKTFLYFVESLTQNILKIYEQKSLWPSRTSQKWPFSSWFIIYRIFICFFRKLNIPSKLSII